MAGSQTPDAFCVTNMVWPNARMATRNKYFPAETKCGNAFYFPILGGSFLFRPKLDCADPFYKGRTCLLLCIMVWGDKFDALHREASSHLLIFLLPALFFLVVLSIGNLLFQNVNWGN